MKGLNSNKVNLIINGFQSDKIEKKFNKEISQNTFHPADEKYDALDDFNDPIDTKTIVDCVNTLSIIGKGNNEITSGSIMLELKRLIIRSIRADTDTIDINILDSKLVCNIMDTIKQCVDDIVINRSDNENYFRSIILYNIAAIFDLYSISTSSKEAVKLATFINYFIDAFTKTSK